MPRTVEITRINGQPVGVADVEVDLNSDITIEITVSEKKGTFSSCGAYLTHPAWSGKKTKVEVPRGLTAQATLKVSDLCDPAQPVQIEGINATVSGTQPRIRVKLPLASFGLNPIPGKPVADFYLGSDDSGPSKVQVKMSPLTAGAGAKVKVTSTAFDPSSVVGSFSAKATTLDLPVTIKNPGAYDAGSGTFAAQDVTLEAVSGCALDASDPGKTKFALTVKLPKASFDATPIQNRRVFAKEGQDKVTFNIKLDKAAPANCKVKLTSSAFDDVTVIIPTGSTSFSPQVQLKNASYSEQEVTLAGENNCVADTSSDDKYKCKLQYVDLPYVRLKGADTANNAKTYRKDKADQVKVTVEIDGSPARSGAQLKLISTAFGKERTYPVSFDYSDDAGPFTKDVQVSYVEAGNDQEVRLEVVKGCKIDPAADDTNCFGSYKVSVGDVAAIKIEYDTSTGTDGADDRSRSYALQDVVKLNVTLKAADPNEDVTATIECPLFRSALNITIPKGSLTPAAPVEGQIVRSSAKDQTITLKPKNACQAWVENDKPLNTLSISVPPLPTVQFHLAPERQTCIAGATATLNVRLDRADPNNDLDVTIASPCIVNQANGSNEVRVTIPKDTTIASATIEWKYVSDAPQKVELKLPTANKLELGQQKSFMAKVTAAPIDFATPDEFHSNTGGVDADSRIFEVGQSAENIAVEGGDTWKNKQVIVSCSAFGEKTITLDNDGKGMVDKVLLTKGSMEPQIIELLALDDKGKKKPVASARKKKILVLPPREVTFHRARAFRPRRPLLTGDLVRFYCVLNAPAPKGGAQAYLMCETASVLTRDPAPPPPDNPNKLIVQFAEGHSIASVLAKVTVPGTLEDKKSLKVTVTGEVACKHTSSNKTEITVMPSPRISFAEQDWIDPKPLGSAQSYIPGDMVQLRLKLDKDSPQPGGCSFKLNSDAFDPKDMVVHFPGGKSEIIVPVTLLKGGPDAVRTLLGTSIDRYEQAIVVDKHDRCDVPTSSSAPVAAKVLRKVKVQPGPAVTFDGTTLALGNNATAYKPGAKAELTVQLASAAIGDTYAKIKSDVFGGQVYLVKVKSGETTGKITVVWAWGDDSFHDVEVLPLRRCEAGADDKRKFKVKVSKPSSGTVDDPTVSCPLKDTKAPTDEKCNFHHLDLIEEHGKQHESKPERGSDSNGTFEIWKHGDETNKQHYGTTARPAVIQVIAGRYGEFASWTPAEGKFHATCIALKVDPQAYYCSQKFISPNGVKAGHPLVTVREVLEDGDLKDVYPLVTDCQSRAKSGAVVYRFFAAQAEGMLFQKWSRSKAVGSAALAIVAPPVKTLLKGIMAVCRPKVRRYQIEAETCGNSKDPTNDADKPADTIRAIVEVYPSDEFCIAIKGSPAPNVSWGWEGQHLNGDGTIKSKKSYYDDDKHQDKSYQDQKGASGVDAVDKDTSGGSYVDRGAQALEEDEFFDDDDLPDNFDDLATSTDPEVAKKLEKPVQARTALQQASDGEDYCFYPADAPPLFQGLGMDFDSPNKDKLTDSQKKQVEQDEKEYKSGRVPDWVEKLFKVSVTRNGRESEQYAAVRNTIQYLAFLLKGTAGLMSASTNCIPQMGFSFNMSFSCLEGEFKYRWGWKEGPDNRAFVWKQLATKMMLFRFALQIDYGLKANMIILKFQAIVYLRITGPEVTWEKQWSVKGPDEALQGDPDWGWFGAAGKVEAGLSFICAHEDFLSAGAAIKTGLKSQFRWRTDVAAMEYEIYFLGVSAQVTFKALCCFQKIKVVDLIEGSPSELPWRRGILFPRDANDTLWAVREDLGLIFKKFLWRMGKVEDLLDRIDALQLRCVRSRTQNRPTLWPLSEDASDDETSDWALQWKQYMQTAAAEDRDASRRGLGQRAGIGSVKLSTRLAELDQEMGEVRVGLIARVDRIKEILKRLRELDYQLADLEDAEDEVSTETVASFRDQLKSFKREYDDLADRAWSGRSGRGGLKGRAKEFLADLEWYNKKRQKW